MGFVKAVRPVRLYFWFFKKKCVGFQNNYRISRYSKKPAFEYKKPRIWLSVRKSNYFEIRRKKYDFQKKNFARGQLNLPVGRTCYEKS